MIPDNSEELRVLAGEYVLGVLDARETSEVAAALAINSELRRAVAFSEDQLHPLSSLATSAEPPPGTWQAIEVRIRTNASKPVAHSFWTNLALWRWSTAGFRCRGACSLDGCYVRARAEPCGHPSPPAARSGKLDSNCRPLWLGPACGYDCDATTRPSLRALGHCPWGGATAIARCDLPEWGAKAVSTTA